MAQLAVAWVLQNDNVASAITGGSRPDQVRPTPRRPATAVGGDPGRHRRTPWATRSRPTGPWLAAPRPKERLT